MENIDVRITQYPRKTVVSDFDIFLIADVTDIDVVTGFPKYKKVMAKDLPSIVNTASDITYADLLAKALEGELSVGEFYNITDSTSGIAPILVQAVSDSAIGYLAFDGNNPLLTVNYDFITDTVRWSKDQDSEPVALDSFSAVTPLSYDDVTGVFTISQSSATTDGYLSSDDWDIFNAKQDALNGTGIVKSTGGVISYLTDNTTNWDSAYNDTITNVAVTGTTTKLLTLTQRDGGTLTTNWSDLNAVTSVFGRTGAVTAQSGDYTTTQVTEGTNLYYTQDRFNSAFSLKSTTDLTEGTNLYYTDLRARGAFSETVTGLTYNPSSGVLSTTSGYGIPTTASQSNWDTAYTNRITSASAPLSIAANAISISQASSTTNGYLSSGDWSAFNAKQPAGNYITALSGEATATGPNNATVTLSNSAVIGKTLTGLNITGGSVSSSDSILAAFGKVQNQINGLIGGTIYQGTWDASTNDPFLESGVGTKGWYYIVNVAGSTNLDGITDWNLGDWAIYDGSAWQQVDNTDAVVSVNGQTGVVSLSTTNIAEGTNLYFTQTRVSANSDVAANTAARHSAVTLGTANGLSLATQQLSLALSSASTTGALSSSDWSTFNSKQAVLNGTGIVKSTSGTITYVTDNSANWNSAYNNMIDSASVTGTTTKTLTLYQQDGGTITTNWTDENTDIVTSVFGRIGDVTAQSGDYTTTQVTEGDNLYFTQLRVSANTDVAANTAARHNAVTLGNANGLALSNQQLSLGLSSSTTTGSLNSTDWNTFNNKQNALGFTPEPAITAGTTLQYWRGDKTFQVLDTSVVPEGSNHYYTSTRFNTSFATKTTSDLTEGTNLYYTDARARAAITLTTTGTSGAATYVGGTLNIPDYSSALGGYLPLSGGTLTGALYGTTATFSGVVSTKGSAPYYQWLNASDVRLAYIQHNGSDLVIATDTGDVVLAPTGKVGIKNDAPSQNLTVGDGTGTNNQYVRIFASASDIYIGQSGGTLFGQSANSAGYVLSDNISFPFVVGTIAAQDLIFGTNNTARITINGSTGALTATSSITASSFVKSGGTSSQFLLADGSVTTLSTANWNTAYNDSIVSAAVTGTSTKTLTLNQQDGGTVTASWSDADTGLTSVGLSMPSAFSVSNSPLTSNGTIAVTGAGTTAQYVRGDGSLATFPTASQEAKTLITEVYNETGATLTKGTVVYINGGHGNLPTITKALANSDATSAQTYGVVQNDITTNNNGFVVVIGSLTDISTNGYANGTILYLSPTTAGQWTSTKPYAPQHIVYVGIVVREHPTQGVVEIKIQNGYEMDELHNVAAQSPSNGDILQYVSSTSLWTKTAGTTSAISEGSNLYYTDARARAAITGTSPISVSSGVVSISQASGSANGYLSSTDWTTFNSKQPAGNYITALTGEATASGPNSASVTLTNSAVIGKVLTGLNVTGGSVSATDSILAAFGKVQNQINGLIGGSIYQSVWNASTNSPTLASGVGTKGYYYIVNVAGSTNLDGITDWKVGDWAIYDGTAWQKVDNTDAVSSVNGQTGAVSLTTSNISEGSNLYYTAARFNSAFSGKTTTDLTEGTNLYYTSTRFDSAFSAKTTSNLTEGSNLYYTAARFNSAFSGKSTSDLAEGTNLYYTDTRARAAISSTATGLTYSSGVISLTSGYVIPTTTQQTNWNNVYTNAVYTTSTYSNPLWLTSLAWTKISGTPTTVSGYGITDAITTANIGSQSVAYATSAGNADTVDNYHAAQLYTTTANAAGSFLGGHYSSGGTEKPDSATFGAGKLKLAMLSGSNLGFGGGWNDVLWLSAYSGGDVKSSHALVFDKYSSNVWVSDQNFDSNTWGTGYLLLSTANYNNYAPTLTGSGASGTWSINITGNAATATSSSSSTYATTAGALTSMNISQFTNDSGYMTPTSSTFSYTASLTLTSSWQNTGVNSANLTGSGVYIVACNVNDYGVGGGQYNCTYTGMMYWFAGGTNGSNTNEIILHHTGHADNGRYIYLRTINTVSADGKTYLQISGNGTNSGASNYQFTFKKLL